jgi:hypothetical protein
VFNSQQINILHLLSKDPISRVMFPSVSCFLRLERGMTSGRPSSWPGGIGKLWALKSFLGVGINSSVVLRSCSMLEVAMGQERMTWKYPAVDARNLEAIRQIQDFHSETVRFYPCSPATKRLQRGTSIKILGRATSLNRQLSSHSWISITELAVSRCVSWKELCTASPPHHPTSISAF